MNNQNQSLIETCSELLLQLKESDFLSKQKIPGVEKHGEGLSVPLFGQPYHISVNGVEEHAGNEANPAINILILTYILNWPETPPREGEWISYREMEGGGPLAGHFAENTQKIIETTFAGKAGDLHDAALRANGTATGETGYDLSFQFSVLPNVLLLLRFNDVEDSFPAQSSILFRQSAQAFLGLKPLGIAGTLLVGKLLGAD